MLYFKGDKKAILAVLIVIGIIKTATYKLLKTDFIFNLFAWITTHFILIFDPILRIRLKLKDIRMNNNCRKIPVRFAALLFLAAILASCGASRQGTARSTEPIIETTETTRIDESFDPVMLQDEDINFPERTIPQQQAETPILANGIIETEEVEPNRVIDGFRVQIFATQNIENATLQKKEAEFVFLGDSVAVYIDFDSPMYKIRVGDCLNRAEAENLREIARKHGYPTSFIVRTKVNTIPVLPQNEEEAVEDQ